MNTIRKSIIIGLAVLGMGGTTLAVQAQDGRHATAAAKEQAQAKWSERAAARQQKLREHLKLTPSQDAAFAAYMAAAKPAGFAAQRDRAAWKSMSAPARMEQQLAMARSHVAAMETRLAALNTFYAVLTPEQKKVFDEKSQRGWGGKRGHGGHGGHHGHGGHGGHGKAHGMEAKKAG